MDNDQEIKELEDYLKSLGEIKASQIYNSTIIDKKLKEYSIQFHQLKAYFNFKRKLDKALNNNLMSNNLTQCYLIDKNWFRKWKKYIGYDEFKKDYDNHSLNRDIINDDYKWINSIIKKNSREKLLSPLDNTEIFYNNDINPLADFIIVDNNCYRLFSLGRRGTENDFSKKKYFRIKCLNRKIIVELTNQIYLIIFLNNTPENETPNIKANFAKKMITELLIFIKDENPNKGNFIKDIEEKDMNIWINESKIDINQINNDQFYFKNGINFKIINKSHISNQKKIFMKNEFKEREEEILN